jgi:hypothetical protein
VTDVVFYIATHPDDALLFRGEVLYSDSHLEGAQVVHITVTAGDAGNTDGWWQRREAGTLAALRATQSPGGSPQPVMTAVNGHRIARYPGAGFTAYCMRLPDGSPNGAGYPSNGGASLRKLAAGTISSVDAVDGSTTYSSWSDLCDTVRAICAHERQSGGTVAPWINASDPDRSINPGDHADHYAVGEAVSSFAAPDGYRIAWWVSDNVGLRSANLSGFPLAAKRFLFETYGAQADGPDEDEWSWWGAKSYVRTERRLAASGDGRPLRAGRDESDRVISAAAPAPS